MNLDNMTLEEVVALVHEPPSLERSMTYVLRRRCGPYPPFHGRRLDELPEHMAKLDRKCFNCGHNKPEHAGTCWGNQVCQMWVCGDCAGQVMAAHAEHKARQVAEEAEARR